MTTLNASQARIPPAAFNRVVYAKERLRIQRRSGESAYLVSAEDLALLEKAEDEYWAKEGMAALKRFEESGEKSIPWAKVKAKLKLGKK